MTTPSPAAGPARRGPALTSLLVLVTVLAVVWSALAVAPAPARADPPDGAPIEVALDAIDPAVAGPDTELTVTGTIRNVTEQPVRVDTVRVSTAYRGLDTPSAVAGWADGDLGESVDTPLVVGEARIEADLAPGAVVNFRAVVDEEALAPPFGFATLPLRIEAVAGTGEDDAPATGEVVGGLRSFLPWDGQTGEEYRPIRVSWLVPVTLPPTPDLLSSDAATREAAWTAATGPDSATRRLLSELAGTAVTFLVDPALVSPPAPVPTLAPPEDTGEGTEEEPPGETTGPSATESPTTESPTTEPSATGPSATGSPTAAGQATDPATTQPPGDGASATETGPDTDPPAEDDDTATEGPGTDPEVPGTAGDAAGLRRAIGQVDPDRLWWLPAGDLDLVALLDLGMTPEEIAPLTDRSNLAADGAAGLLATGRHDIAWPALDTVTEDTLAALAAVWASAASEGGTPEETAPLAGTVVPGSSVTGDRALLGDAVSVHPDGTALLGFDERLSAMVAGVDSADGSGVVSQRLIAELLALYQEQPAAERSLLIALPRNHGVSPEALGALYGATADLPWAQAVPLQDLVEDAGSQDGQTRLVSAAPEGEDTDDGETPEEDPGAYPSTPSSPLTTARIDLVEETRATLAGVGEVVPEGVAGAHSWDGVLDQLYSVRWRFNEGGWTEPLLAAQALSTEIVDGIHVNPTTINFLADEGLIQITVVNELPVTVSDLTLTVRPRNPRLRIVEQPEPIQIGPSSRATVQFRARALASGEVEVETELSTPSGTMLADQQLMRVNVRPTGVWIYWVLGGVAGIILVLGVWRALRPQRSGAQGAATPQTTDGDGDGTDERSTEH